jgi:hypothetical protein
MPLEIDFSIFEWGFGINLIEAYRGGTIVNAIVSFFFDKVPTIEFLTFTFL